MAAQGNYSERDTHNYTVSLEIQLLLLNSRYFFNNPHIMNNTFIQDRG
jgi:hypothetical protein